MKRNERILHAKLRADEVVKTLSGMSTTQLYTRWKSVEVATKDVRDLMIVLRETQRPELMGNVIINPVWSRVKEHDYRPKYNMVSNNHNQQCVVVSITIDRSDLGVGGDKDHSDFIKSMFSQIVDGVEVVSMIRDSKHSIVLKLKLTIDVESKLVDAIKQALGDSTRDSRLIEIKQKREELVNALGDIQKKIDALNEEEVKVTREIVKSIANRIFEK